MATLQSPGVQVTVIDESFYTPAAPGTVPLIIVASAQDKTNSSGTGIAQGTTKANAGKVWTITSQRDLTDTFGTPKFYTDSSNNPVHGGELNEYGLQAAYSLLAVSSRAYIVRADMDLNQLTITGTIPVGQPVNGTFWLDTANSVFGINQWDATNKVFVNKTPIVIDDTNADTRLVPSTLTPKTTVGSIGDYAVVATSDNETQIWYKNSDNVWVKVGSNVETQFASNNSTSTWISNSWQTSFPVITSTGFSNFVNPALDLVINGTSVTIGNTSTTGIATSINSQLNSLKVGAKVNASGRLEIYSAATTNTNGAVTLAGTLLSSVGLSAGTYTAVTSTIARHTQVPQYGTTLAPSGSIYIKTTAPSRGANWVVKRYNSTSRAWQTNQAGIYDNGAAAIRALDSTGGKAITEGTLYVESNYDHGTGNTSDSQQLSNFKIYRRSALGNTTITGNSDITSFNLTSFTDTSVTYSFSMAESLAGSATPGVAKTIVVGDYPPNTATTNVVFGDDVVTAISAAGFTNITAELNSEGKLVISHNLGGEIYLTENNNSYPIISVLGFSEYDPNDISTTQNLYQGGFYDTFDLVASNWKPLVYEARSTQPSTEPANGTLWYGSNLTEVDIMYHNGNNWVGYKTAFPNTDSAGPIVSASEPTKQVGGHNGNFTLQDGDIWIDFSDSEAYGKNVYVYNGTTLKWVKQDVTDQETPNGWVFADARWGTSGTATAPASIASLLTSDYVDPDTPDPSQYPQGTRLWNLRRSGYNVKRYIANHIDINANSGINPRYGDAMATYNKNRWVTVSPNSSDGSGTFGRKAQRGFVVASLKSLIDTNSQIRDTDTLVFNLIACPGYPETIQNMIAFNGDRSYTAFVIGDTPFRLRPNGTDLANWGINAATATDNGEEGAVSYDEYMALFYPSGFTTDNSGNSIVVPPSHMMLRTFATSDQKSYQWFAPAGIRRGVVDNATSVGYILNGEFVATTLPTSIRDVMIQTAKVNPIATFNGVGIVNFGNLTRARTAGAGTSLDRINVARLVAYLRRQLDILSRPFLFEPNDKNTRTELKNATESLLVELVSQRALYDFIVVCDESNNTPARIDRNELWLDIAVEPVKSVEYIYIPLRLKKTGSIAAGI